MKRKIYLLTEKRYLNPELKSDYIRNILKEDELLTEALNKYGYTTERIAWDDDKGQIPPGSIALLRSTWNYFEKIGKFERWLAKMADEIHLLNPPATITWNLDKEYLFDLAKAGIDIPETLFIERNTELNLGQMASAKNWHKIIIKPAISATASKTFMLEGDEIKAFEPEFHQLNHTYRYLIQEFQENVVKKGEVSLVYINGEYSHAVLKKAKAGDYRVQDDFGGSVHDYQPSGGQIKTGEQAMMVCRELPLYGRVDMIMNNKNRWVVSELELIEPELWLRRKPECASLLAQAIHNYTLSLPSS